MASQTLPTLADVQAAATRIGSRLHRTPVFRSQTLSSMTGLQILLKCENFQKTGSFKPRGALNRIATLSEQERRAGVITISAGNTAQGIAFAAREAGVHAVLVMPQAAARSKVEATRGYGAEVVLHGDVHAAFERLEQLRRERGLTLLHPFDDPMLIAGHGTLGLEILEQAPEAEAVICGVGGGGMLGGLGTVFGATSGTPRLFAVEPFGAATMTEALAAGHPVRLDNVSSIADGLAPPYVGELNLAIAQQHVEQVARVQEADLRAAVRLLLERTKLLVEPSGAAPLAALVSGALELEPGTTTVLVLSGGNVDVDRLGELLGG